MGTPYSTRRNDLCEFFELDPNIGDETPMALCRHCGAVTLLCGDFELCAPCSGKFHLVRLKRELGRNPEALIRFHCSRTYRRRWLKQSTEGKHSGGGNVLRLSSSC